MYEIILEKFPDLFMNYIVTSFGPLTVTYEFIVYNVITYVKLYYFGTLLLCTCWVAGLSNNIVIFDYDKQLLTQYFKNQNFEVTSNKNANSLRHIMIFVNMLMLLYHWLIFLRVFE